MGVACSGGLFATAIRALIVVMSADVAEAQTPPAPRAPEGVWLGTLSQGAVSLRVQITVTPNGSGGWQCVLDSPDQGAYGIPCVNVTFMQPDFSFDVPAVKGHWDGKVADDSHLVGTWTQLAALPLTFERQTVAIRPAARGVSPANPPVSAADMQAVLLHDLEHSVKNGRLAPGSPFGVAVGVVRNGVRSVFVFGAARPDSLFEIGSITKTFTGLALAEMIEEGRVKPGTPVRELLPPGTVKKPEGAEITLLDLTTQHSGLPRLPDNLDLTNVVNPYASYDAAKLDAFLGSHGVARPAGAGFEYSNLGVGLLGYVLSLRAGKPYAQLIKAEITGPLGMKDTVIPLTPAQQSRFMQGYSNDGRAVHSWEFEALQGAGALRSTAGDMLTYLEAQLHPQKLPGGVTDATLSAAIVRSQAIQADAEPIGKIAYNWMQNKSGDYLHDGATGGFSSFAFFNPRENFGAIVLTNSGASAQPFATILGVHIRQRFEGVPAVSLEEPAGAPK